jgi:hypothetical protein
MAANATLADTEDMTHSTHTHYWFHGLEQQTVPQQGRENATAELPARTLPGLCRQSGGGLENDVRAPRQSWRKLGDVPLSTGSRGILERLKVWQRGNRMQCDTFSYHGT